MPEALAELAELWVDSTDRAAISRASDLIDRELLNSPDTKGEAVEGSLRKFVAHPLVFYYVVSPDDMLVVCCFIAVSRLDGLDYDLVGAPGTNLVGYTASQIGGPPEYIQEHWDRLVGTAQHLAELRAGA